MSCSAAELRQLELDSARAEQRNAEADAHFERVLLEHARSQAATQSSWWRLPTFSLSSQSLCCDQLCCSMC